MRVALFVTCYNDLLFPEVGKATVKLLRRLGQEVEFPEAQTCCGQIHFNTGYRDQCVPLVRGFVAAFDGYDAIVTPSASCAKPIAARPALTTAQSCAIVSRFGSGACGNGAVGSSFTAKTSHPKVANHFGLKNEHAPLQQSTATVSFRDRIASPAKLSLSTLTCSSIGFSVCTVCLIVSHVAFANSPW